jgi:hypothetical protein
MTGYKYASWVKGEYLVWAKEQQNLNENFSETNMYQFLKNGYSEPVLKTLRVIAEAEPTSKLINLKYFPAYTGIKALEIADTLLHLIEHECLDTKKVQKKSINPTLNQFRNATNKLFNLLHSTHIYKASDLIEGAPDMLVTGTNIESMCKDKAALTLALTSFWGKTAHQVLLDFADEVEAMTNEKRYFVVNKKDSIQRKTRVGFAVGIIIDMVGIDAIKELNGLADLIIYFIEFIDNDTAAPLCNREVNRQIKSITEAWVH